MRQEGRIVVRYVWYLNLVAYCMPSAMNTNNVCNMLLFEQDVCYCETAEVRIIDLLKFLTTARRPVRRSKDFQVDNINVKFHVLSALTVNFTALWE
jgi:hypothetical protein